MNIKKDGKFYWSWFVCRLHDNAGFPTWVHLPVWMGTFRPVTMGAQGGETSLENFSPPLGKMCWTLFKTIGHSLKNLGPSQKNLRSP